MQIISNLKQIPITLFLTCAVLLLHTATTLQPAFSLHFDDLTFVGSYRILTCHLLHWSTDHLVWDVAVFAFLGACCELRCQQRLAWTLLVSALVIPLCIIYGLPQIDSYRGLSGLDTALFGLLVSSLLLEKVRERDSTGTAIHSILLVGLAGKTLFEAFTQTNIFVSDLSFTPVPLAHFLGGTIGLAAGVLGEGRIEERRIERSHLPDGVQRFSAT